MKKSKKIFKSTLSLFLVCLCIASVAVMSPKSSASSEECINGWEETTYYDPTEITYGICSGYHWDWEKNKYVKVHDVLSGDLVAPVKYYTNCYDDDDGNEVCHTYPSSVGINCKDYDDCPTSVTVTGASSCGFSSCEKLESVNLSSIGVHIGDSFFGSVSFYNCPNLKELNLSTGVDIYVDDCDGLEKFSYNNTGAGEKEIFIENCSSLKDVKVNSHVDKLSVKNAPSITYISMPDSVKWYGIEKCNNLEYVKLAACDIPEDMFENYTKLKTVVIPYGVTSIGSRAFRGCTSLKSINIPASVTEIGLQTFSFTGLGDVYFGGTKAQWKEITQKFYYDVFPNGTTVHCSDGIYDLCTCKCHSNSFMKFIYKIISTIRNFFGLDSHCACGWTHIY